RYCRGFRTKRAHVHSTARLASLEYVHEISHSCLVTLTASPAALAGNFDQNSRNLLYCSYADGRASLSNSYALMCTLPIPIREICDVSTPLARWDTFSPPRL